MKTIIGITVLIIVLVGGYFLLTLTNTEGLPEDKTVSGEVTNVNLDAITLDGPVLITLSTETGEEVIAVPSMGLPLCAAVANIGDVYTLAEGDQVTVTGSVDEEGRIVPCESESHELLISSTMQDAVLGFEFTYRKGPDGYITLEDTESTDPSFVTGITLFNKAEYELFTQATDAREGPPAINVRVYENTENLSSFVWPERNQQESNIGLVLGDVEETVVGGANAAHYTVDGLYPMSTYVVANGDHVYVLSGAYLDQSSDIYKDFEALVQSFTFIQIAGQE